MAKSHSSHLTTFQVFMMLLHIDRFDDLYVAYERDESVPRKTIGAQELILDLLKERGQRLVVCIDEHRPL